MPACNLLTYINNGELKAGDGYCYTEPKTKNTFPATLDGERGLFIFEAHGKKHEVKSPTKYVGICTPCLLYTSPRPRDS